MTEGMKDCGGLEDIHEVLKYILCCCVLCVCVLYVCGIARMRLPFAATVVRLQLTGPTLRGVEWWMYVP